jgi:hypothetical protein
MSNTPAGSRSSAERTRRHRARRRRGMRCIPVLVSEDELAALVAKGLLAEEARGDALAIKKAIEAVISDMAFEQQFGLAPEGEKAQPKRVTG